MGLQSLSSVSALGGLLAQSFYQSLFLSALRSYNSATAQLRAITPSPQRQATEANLLSQISSLTAISDGAANAQAEFDAVGSALDSASTDLSSLASIATSAVSGNAAARATYQSQAEALLETIEATLTGARNTYSDFYANVSIPTTVVESVNVSSITADISSSGLTFALDISDTGSRAKLNDLFDASLSGADNTEFDSALAFTITGPDGSANFSFSANTTVSAAITAINDKTGTTGVIAVADGASKIDLYSVKYGTSQTITLTETTDTGGDLTAGSATGTNATGTLTVGGIAETVTGDGRTIAFNHGGVAGTIELISDATNLSESSNPGSVNYTVYSGGKAIVGPDGDIVGRFAVPGLNFGSLGRSVGSLSAIDLENDPGGALKIINEAISDLADSESIVDFASGTLLDNQITSITNTIGTLEGALDDIDDVGDAIALFEQTRLQTQATSSLTILGQLANLFPASFLGLV